MSRPAKLTVAQRRALFFERRAARNRASFDRDLAAHPAGVSKISSNGGIVCRSHPTVGIAPPPTKSKFTPDSRGRWHFNADA
ncbi:MAG: hypothetical protein ACO3PR_00010 [Limisphaerales bacterium]